MKRIVAIVTLIVVLAGCTPGEVQVWADWVKKDPAAATAEFNKQFTQEAKVVSTPIPHVAPPGSKCPGWYDEAMDAGFTYRQWPTVDRIIWRESRCQQGVHNSAGANGLMQVMAMWADDCNTTVAGLRNGAINLRCAKHILDVQGWSAWA